MTRPAFFDHSREKEARLQRALISALEQRFGERVADAIRAEAQRIASIYADTGTLPALDDAHEIEMLFLYEEMAEAAIRTFGIRILEQGKAIGRLEYKQEDEGRFTAFFRRLVQDWIGRESIRERITRVARQTRDRIVDAVSRGERDGLGVAEIAKRINDEMPSISRQRGALIARTETHGAANYGAHETAKSTGLDLKKEWLAIEDDRTRSILGDDEFDHRAMDGQVQPMDAPFLMPWAARPNEPLRIMFPGEPGHPGGATINCRCATAHVVEGLDD